MKKKIFITIDTECAGLKDPVYDIGWTIHDKKGEIFAQYHALVREVFTDGEKMVKAYFAKKIFSDYAPMLDAGEISIQNWSTIVDIMRGQIEEFGVNVVAAYNLGFDVRALKMTNDMFGDGSPVFAGKPVQLLDLWQFACEVLLNTATYKKTANANGWVSPVGNIKTSAEMAYRFIINNPEFIEDHTALSDALIETEILAKCFAKKGKVPYGVMNAQPWRIVNEK